MSKSYDGDSLAVANLDLAIAKGEFVTFLGPSGSGKTTSLMMLAGFEAPTAGDIRLAGRSVSRIPPHRRNIGMVFQNYALFPNMTVAENIAFPLSVRGVPREERARRVDKALALVRLAGFGHRRPTELSGGQQQRVAVARAVVFDPDLVLMDEPLGALDKQLREQLQLEIKNIHANLGVTIVYVTHDQSEALTLSDRIAVFKDGGICQIGRPVDIYERPATSFVAQFIGEGSPTTLSVRPEHVVIDPADGPWDNIVPARLDSLIYHGDHARAQFRLAGGQPFTVKISNPRHAGAFAVGVDVRLAWRASDCRALDPLC